MQNTYTLLKQTPPSREMAHGPETFRFAPPDLFATILLFALGGYEHSNGLPALHDSLWVSNNECTGKR